MNPIRINRRTALMAISLFSGGALAALSIGANLSLASDEKAVTFTAEFLQRRVDADGGERYRFERTVARKSDGSRAEKEIRYYRSQGKDVILPSQHVWDTQSRKLIAAYPQVHGKITTTLSDTAVQRLSAHPRATCPQSGFDPVNPGDTSIASIPVVVRQMRVEAKDEQPETRIREWVAPSLGCVVLKRQQQWFDATNQPLPGDVVLEVVRLTQGEPSAEAFQVSGNLREMSPSEVMTAQNALQGRTCTDCDRKAMENGDRYYFANRADD